jgi:hypothetical protein
MGYSEHNCGDPSDSEIEAMPKNLNSFTIVQLKQQLTKRGESDLTGKKACLVVRLQGLLDKEAKSKESVTHQQTSPADDAPEEQAVLTEMAPDVAAKSTLTLEVLMSLKVVDLKKELKARGLPVSGLKAALHNRLADAEGLSLDPTGNDSATLVTKENPFKEIGNKMSGGDDVQTSKVPPSTKPIIKKQTTKKASKATSKASPPVSDDKPATKAQVCIVIDKTNQKSNKVTFALTSDENAVNGAVKSIHWKSVPPKDGGSETDVVNNVTFYWCAKCKSWKDSHMTSEHKNKPGKKRNNNKKSNPLTPSRPGGRPMGLAFTPPARLLANRKQTPGMNKKLIF